MFTTSTFAAHNNDNSVTDHRNPGWGGGGGGGRGGFLQSVADLQNAVRYSGINYTVQNAVDNFASHAYAYQSCTGGFAVRAEPGTTDGEYGTRDHRDGRDGRNGRYGCESYRQNMHYSFQQVSNYLYDTSWDFPQVYNSWRNVQYMMQRI